MKTRRGFASCAVLVLLVVANTAAAQTRERRQDRRTQPKQAEEPVITTLFEQTDVLYWVHHTAGNGAEVCQIQMGDKASKTVVWIETNASDHTAIIAQNFTDPLPGPYARLGTKQSLRVEVDGVAQTYSIKTLEPAMGGAWAEGIVPRAALRHLQSAVNSRRGFVVKVGDGEPMRFSVPPRAADAFHECGRGILHGRANRLLEQMR